MGIWNGLKRASRAIAESTGPAKYSAGGKQVRCEHCGRDQFTEGNAQLNTAGMTFMGLDWANQTATTLTCHACGRIHWFGIRPQRH